MTAIQIPLVAGGNKTAWNIYSMRRINEELEEMKEGKHGETIHILASLVFSQGPGGYNSESGEAWLIQ
jgi:hypothetical protein